MFSLKSHKTYGNKKFHAFSGLLILIFFVALAFAAYVFSVRQINHTYVNQQLTLAGETIKMRVAAEISGELALITKMADSPTIKRYMLTPEDETLRAYAHAEFEMLENKVTTGQLFWVNNLDKVFYFSGVEPYILEPERAENYWYDMTLYETEDFNFNINYNPDLDMINLWVNVPVFDEVDYTKEPIGMLGLAFNLPEIIRVTEEAHKSDSHSMTAYLFNKQGEITIASDFNLVHEKVLLKDHLGDSGERVIEVASSVGVHGLNYIFGDYMYRVERVPAIKDWSLVLQYPLPGMLALNNELNIVFFAMLLLIVFLYVVMNLFIIRSESAIRSQNAQLIAANREVQKASNAKSSFLATMSHEIRTPMNAILGITQMQLRNTNMPAENIEAFEKIYNSGNILLGIINDILDMSKIETGKLELIKSDYDVASLIHDTVQMNIVRIGDKPIEFIVNADEKLPAKLVGDELRLKQILNNVLSNAIKYTQSGYVKLELTHKVQNGKVLLTITVEDTGQGMTKDSQNKLFTEYQRFNSETNQYIEGTGLGLNITKTLVELMGGKITVKSEFGKGSTFVITVWQDAVEHLTIGSKVSKSLEEFTFAVRKRENTTEIRNIMPYGKVLVVDDVETNLYVASGLLSAYQIHVDTAISGFEAIAKVFPTETDMPTAGTKVDSRPYDIIFMDHMMPDMDGIETTQRLRQMGYEGAVVALTANAIVGNAEMFRQNRFNDFVSKPIDTKRLDDVLNKYIRDKYPAEAAKYKEVKVEAKEPSDGGVDPKLLKVFCDDAKKAIATLQNLRGSGDVLLFITTVHAMKSALANIGKPEESKRAFELEDAGRKRNFEFINANIDDFVKTLEQLVAEYAPPETVSDDSAVTEDTEFLNGQLTITKSACEDYNKKAVFAALETLKSKEWKKSTSDALEKIHDTIYFESDFEAASELIDAVLADCTQSTSPLLNGSGTDTVALDCKFVCN